MLIVNYLFYVHLSLVSCVLPAVDDECNPSNALSEPDGENDKYRDESTIAQHSLALHSTKIVIIHIIHIISTLTHPYQHTSPPFITDADSDSGQRYSAPPKVFLSRPSGHVSEWAAVALGAGANKVMQVRE